MEQADLILRSLQDFRDETLRRFEQFGETLAAFRDETLRRFEQIDKRFEQVDKRFEQVDRALESLKDEIREVRRELHADHRKLDEVYEARQKVKITFGWQWGLVSFFIAVLAAGITKVFD